MKEITITDQAICDFIKSYCYNKMSKWNVLVDMYGADVLQQKIEEQVQQIQLDPQKSIYGIAYVHKGEPSIYLHEQPENVTLETIQKNTTWLDAIMHQVLHKIWEGEDYTACYTIGGNGEALGEGLTQWSVQKMNKIPLQEDGYQRYTVLIEVLERFLGEHAILQLSKNDRTPLIETLGKENVDVFLTHLDSHLQMHRANTSRAQLSKVLTKLIAYMEVGIDEEDMKEFYALQRELYNCKAYSHRKFLVTEEEGTLAYYKKLNDAIVRMHTETKVQADRTYQQALYILTNQLLQKRFEALQTNKTRNIEEFQKLARSVAECTLASQQECWKKEEKIALYEIMVEKSLHDPLGELRENMALLQEQWEKEIVEDIQKNAKKPKKLPTCIAEMSELMCYVQWKESDHHWRLRVADAMGIEPEKQADVATLLCVAEKEEDLENYRTYTIQSFQNGDAVMKKQGKPFKFMKNGVETDKIKPLEENENWIDFTLPLGTDIQTHVKNFENFKKLAMSRETDAHILFVDGMIVLEHGDHTYEYYRFDEQAKVMMLLPDLEKGEVYANGKQKKPSIKEKMHQWIQKRFTSKTSVRLLAEGKKEQETKQTTSSTMERRKSFLASLQTRVQGASEKQLAKKAQKQLEKKEQAWLRGE